MQYYQRNTKNQGECELQLTAPILSDELGFPPHLEAEKLLQLDFMPLYGINTAPPALAVEQLP